VSRLLKIRSRHRKLLHRIVATPDTCSGSLRIRGTRLPVDCIRWCIEAGNSDEQIVEKYPRATKANVDAVRVLLSLPLPSAGG